MKNTVKILKALADSNRLRILKMLQHKKGCCVCEIQHILGIGQSSTSRHLKILEEAELIRYERDGKWVNCYMNYGSNNKAIRDILNTLNGWLEEDNAILADKKQLTVTDRSIICKP
ncbi:MAG: metalloregulator ArsR/SmtB family transcription factor [Firmicutes bacterium]|nr:metalloregulator ArsR/SmtB family transcription factor [Bacillota bacterium]